MANPVAERAMETRTSDLGKNLRSRLKVVMEEGKAVPLFKEQGP